MQGSIRLVVGFFIAYGAVGTLDADYEASVLVQGALAMLGLVIMGWGVAAMKKQGN
jgi:hypothetical protein